MTTWTDDAVATLGELRREGRTYGEIAIVMGRSHDAVKNAACRYGFGAKHPPGRTYNRNGRPSAERHKWGYIPSHGLNPDAVFAGAKFEDDPRASRREQPLHRVGWRVAR